MADKKFAFIVDWRDKKKVTVEEVQDFFSRNGTSVDTITSGSMKDAVRIFNQRHTVLAWGKVKPKYNVVME